MKRDDETTNKKPPTPPIGYRSPTSDSLDSAVPREAEDTQADDMSEEASENPDDETDLRNTNTCSNVGEQRGIENESDTFKKCESFQNKPPALSEEETKAVLSLRRYSLYAITGAFISFLIGGSLLALVSLICGIVCYRKTSQFNEAHPSLSEYAPAFKKRAVIAIVVPAVALILNVIAVAVLMPVILQAAQTGDYSMLLGGGATNSVTNSTWG